MLCNISEEWDFIYSAAKAENHALQMRDFKAYFWKTESVFPYTQKEGKLRNALLTGLNRMWNVNVKTFIVNKHFPLNGTKPV
jgi:uncharacterized DUF497 family protein